MVTGVNGASVTSLTCREVSLESWGGARCPQDGRGLQVENTREVLRSPKEQKIISLPKSEILTTPLESSRQFSGLTSLRHKLTNVV